MEMLVRFGSLADKLSEKPAHIEVYFSESCSKEIMDEFFLDRTWQKGNYSCDEIKKFIRISERVHNAIKNLPDRGAYMPQRYAKNILERRKEAEILLEEGIDSLNKYVERCLNERKRTR